MNNIVLDLQNYKIPHDWLKWAKKKKKKKSLQSLNDKNNPQTLVVLLLSVVLNYEDV